MHTVTRAKTVVTGGNRGLGLETCRQLARLGHNVVLTSRDADQGLAAADTLAEEGLQVEHHRLDVTSEADAAALAEALSSDGVRALVNNAGASFRGFSADVARRTLEANTLGAINVTRHLIPLLGRKSNVVMVSSGMGELSCVSAELRAAFLDEGLTEAGLRALLESFVASVGEGSHTRRGWPSNAYSVSKVGMNAFTRILARELSDDGVRVNAVCPGWVRTDMGGPGADRSVEVGAHSIVWGATLDPGGPTGGFFRDGEPIPW